MIKKAVCDVCLCKFEYEYKGHKRILCDKCKNKSREQKEKIRENAIKSKKNKFKSIETILCEIEKYNKKNGCYISYGEYMRLTNQYK